MSWLPFLKSKNFDPAQFEKQLADLSKKITSTERNITRLNIQKTRLNQVAIVYGTSSYFVLVLAILGNVHFSVSQLSLNQIGVIIGLPLVFLMLRKLYKVVNTGQINRNTSYLETLKEEHSLKIEELKEKTKYGQTAALLNRFSEGKDANAIVDEEIERKQALLKELDVLAKKQEEENKQAEKEAKGWFDSVLEAVVGGGFSASDSLAPTNRYALICQVCHNHNGLAPPGVLPSKVRYICPRCQQPNGEPVSIASAPVGDTNTEVSESDRRVTLVTDNKKQK